MEAKIIYQEAYINRLYLNIDFEYNNIKYKASCVYLNGCNLEDIEVLEYDTYYELFKDDPIFKIAQDLLENINIKKYITL